MRESAKRSRHEADVVRAGGHFVPLVYDTYGTMGDGAEAWFRGLVAVAHIDFFTILSRTDLRRGVSKAKFDAEADFEVHLPPAFPKSYENIEKLRKISDNFFSIFFFDDFFLPKAS